MSRQRITLPKTAADLLNPARQADLRRAGQLLNAFQNLRLVIKSGLGVSSNVIQVSGKSALLTGEADTLILDPETVIWIQRAKAAGGTFTNNSIAIANALIVAIKRTGFNNSIVYLLPLLGGNLATALVPLRDQLGVGAATNTGFTNADFSQNLGLQGSTIPSKYLDSGIFPSQLGGGTNNGGLGWWESDMANAITSGGGTNVEPLGCYSTDNTERFSLDFRSSVRAGRWGSPGNGPGDGVTPTNGDFYMQRSSATLRQLFYSGGFIAQNITADAATKSNNRTMLLSGNAGASTLPWGGRCACVYMTDGLLSSGDIAQLDQLLRSKLIVPTGRPS